MSITFPERLGLDLIVNKVLQVKCKCERYAARSNHNFGGSVHHKMKCPVYFCENFKSTEGVESKFAVIISAFKIIIMCTILSF